MPCVAVLTGGGFSTQELQDAGTREVYDSPAGLLDHLGDGSARAASEGKNSPR